MKLMIVKRLRVPDVIVDIIKEYVFEDICIKIRQQKLQKKRVEEFLSKEKTIESFFGYFGYPYGQSYVEIMLVTPYRGIHRFTNETGDLKSRRLCRLCGNFECPKGYDYTGSGYYYNRHNPSPFKKSVLCICRQQKLYYRNNDAACPVIEDYKCSSGHNYRKLLV